MFSDYSATKLEVNNKKIIKHLNVFGNEEKYF